MSSNYFRNLKKQQPVDNRPKYLRYGDVFISSKNNINRQQQKYAPNFSNIPRDNFQDPNNTYNNNKYKIFNAANIDRIRDTNYMNSDAVGGQVKNTNTNVYNQYDDNIDCIQQNNNHRACVVDF